MKYYLCIHISQIRLFMENEIMFYTWSSLLLFSTTTGGCLPMLEHTDRPHSYEYLQILHQLPIFCYYT